MIIEVRTRFGTTRLVVILHASTNVSQKGQKSQKMSKMKIGGERFKAENRKTYCNAQTSLPKGAVTFSIMTFSIMTLGMVSLFVTLSINDSQHNDTV